MCSMLMANLKTRRGEQTEYMYMDDTRVLMKYRLPLAEVVTDFYDELKSRTSGYATFDYEENGYEISDLVKVCTQHHDVSDDMTTTIVVPITATFNR